MAIYRCHTNGKRLWRRGRYTDRAISDSSGYPDQAQADEPSDGPSASSKSTFSRSCANFMMDPIGHILLPL
jgi:hypothetical protein